MPVRDRRDETLTPPGSPSVDEPPRTALLIIDSMENPCFWMVRG